MTTGTKEPMWDGEIYEGRPVAHCLECGALRYADDVEYIGEAALGGPNFTYRVGALVERSAGAAPIDVLRLSWAIDEHSLVMRDEPIHDDGTCSTDCAGDIAARYVRLTDSPPR